MTVDVVSVALGAVLGGLVAVFLAWRMVAQGRALQQENQAFARHVEEVHEAQQQLLADTSHELRTPLTTIRGNLDLLQRELPERDRADVLSDTREEVDRMARLVRDLLLLAEAGTGALRIERVPVRLDLLVREVVAHLSATQVDTDTEPVTVIGDDERLRQMVGNLVQNAVRHGSHVTVTVSRRPPQALLIVDDDGPGLPEDALERVFDRFFRLDRGRSRAHGGSGLGLAIVRHVAEEHGGRAWAENRAQGGARFVVSLPAEPSWVID